MNLLSGAFLLAGRFKQQVLVYWKCQREWITRYTIAFVDITKWVEAYAVYDQITATKVALWIDNSICGQGVPMKLLGDNFFIKFDNGCLKKELKLKTIAYHLRNIGLLGNSTKSIRAMIAKHYQSHGSNLDLYLQHLLLHTEPNHMILPKSLLFIHFMVRLLDCRHRLCCMLCSEHILVFNCAQYIFWYNIMLQL